MLQKISLDETAKKFKKFGVDIKKIMADTRKQGGNEFLAMMDAIDKAAQKGAQVSDLFQDQQAQLGYIAYRNARGMREKLLREIGSSAGTVANDLSRIVNDSKSAIDRLSNSWNTMTNTLAMSADKVGVPVGLQNLATELEKIAGIIEKINSGDLAGAGRKTAQYLSGETDDDRTRRRLQNALDNERTARAEAPDSPEVVRLRAQLAALEADDRVPNRGERVRALRERIRIAEGMAGPRNERANEWRRRAAQEAVSLLPPLPEGPTGLPTELIPWNRGLRGGAPNKAGIRPTQGFSTRSQREGVEKSQDNNGAITVPVLLDDVSLTAAAAQAHAAAQGLVNSMPPIRFKAEVLTPSISGQMGSTVSGRVQGAQSDTGSRMGPR
ncbi:hypothetical protein ABB55_00640 [Prosthecomicrobium hirschii]|uniref:Uncharacterized protein n=2 Tax=Prosthecodimorpha hirschii TaxID=665126 RepID=A0A0P6W988_9HYPH|nr:hypothetical protein ABB55_00640 [Prosthecomicrobium hirschii]